MWQVVNACGRKQTRKKTRGRGEIAKYHAVGTTREAEERYQYHARAGVGGALALPGLKTAVAGLAALAPLAPGAPAMVVALAMRAVVVVVVGVAGRRLARVTAATAEACGVCCVVRVALCVYGLLLFVCLSASLCEGMPCAYGLIQLVLSWIIIASAQTHIQFAGGDST